MPLKNVDLALLRTFVEIVNAGTYHAAAETIGRTQSALTQQIFRLEQEVGFELFDRIGRNKVVNGYGMIMYRHAVLMLQMNDNFYELAENVKEMKTLKEGLK